MYNRKIYKQVTKPLPRKPHESKKKVYVVKVKENQQIITEELKKGKSFELLQTPMRPQQKKKLQNFLKGNFLEGGNKYETPEKGNLTETQRMLLKTKCGRVNEKTKKKDQFLVIKGGEIVLNDFNGET